MRFRRYEKPVVALLTKITFQKLFAACYEKNQPISEWVRDAIEMKLSRQEQKGDC